MQDLGKVSKKNIEFMKFLFQNGTIQSQSVFEAMSQVDRGDYISQHPYYDSPQGIGYNVTISAPHMHVAALEYLKDYLQTAKRCLDVGSGSGYLTVAFSKMMKDKDSISYGIEHIPQLVEQSVENIKKRDKDLLESGKVKIEIGDGRMGLKDYAPYDCIHVGAAAETLPQPLVDQLANGGRMLIPVGPQGIGQDFLVIDKDQNGNITKTSAFGVRYVPLTSKEQQCPNLK